MLFSSLTGMTQVILSNSSYSRLPILSMVGKSKQSTAIVGESFSGSKSQLFNACHGVEKIEQEI